MDLNQLKKIEGKLKQINPSKIEQLLKDEVLRNGNEIVDLVRERWKQGIRPDGGIIGTYANFGYQLEKTRKNPLAGGNVDLIDTGALNRDLVVNYLGNSLFTIFSTDEKSLTIAEKYGLDVYGVTKEEELQVFLEASERVYIQLFNFVGL